MRFLKKSIYPLMFCIFGMVMMTAPAFSADAAKSVKTETVKTEAPKPAHSVAVTYFHNTVRCPTCHKIEEQSTQAIKFHFEKELKAGKLVFRVINVDEPANEHYNTDYQLYTKSLIVSEIKDGKEVRWKNLEKIWEFVRDEEQFDKYVHTEIADWLKG